jgi:hypothetical protein
MNARSYPSPHYSNALTALAAQSRFFLQVPYAACTVTKIIVAIALFHVGP